MSWPDPISLGVFVGVVGFVVCCAIVGWAWSAPVGRRARAVAVATGVALAWLALTGGAAAAGIYDVPDAFRRVGPYAFTCLVTAFILAFSPIGRRLATGVPIGALVAFHGFRLPLELVLHTWADQGTVPVDLSYAGQNYDIVVGIAAVLLAPFARRAPWLVLAFDVVGLAFLANIVRIVLRNTVGSPLYVAHGQPPLELAMAVPTTWIVSVCVMGAIAGHLIIARWLWMRWRAPPPAAY